VGELGWELLRGGTEVRRWLQKGEVVGIKCATRADDCGLKDGKEKNPGERQSKTKQKGLIFQQVYSILPVQSANPLRK